MSKLERIQDLHHQLYHGLRDYANHWPLEKVKFMEEDCFEKYKSELVTERSKQAFFRKEETKRLENYAKIPNLMETSIKIMEYTKKTQEKMRTAQNENKHDVKEDELVTFISGMDNLQESLTTIKKLFDTLSQDYKQNEDIFDDLKTWYGYHGCPDGVKDCDENDRIHLIDANEGMLGMLTSVVSDLFIKGDCSVKGNIGTVTVEPWIEAVEQKLNEVETEMSINRIPRQMDDLFVLQKDVRELWGDVKGLNEAADHFKNESEAYHDQCFEIAEDIYGLQHEWVSANSTMWSIPDALANIEVHFQFEIYDEERWQEGVWMVGNYTQKARENFRLYKDSDKSLKSKIGKNNLIAFTKKLEKYMKTIDAFVKKTSEAEEDFKERGKALKDNWFQYTGEMGWSIKNIQTTGMDLGWLQ